MSKKEKKMADAMRIFEALSGVDEELLIRCEDSVEVSATTKKVRPIWYYGKAIAACLCFVVMGVALWSAGPILFDGTKNSSDSAYSAEMQAKNAAQDAVENMDLADVAAADGGGSEQPAEGVTESTNATASGQISKSEETSNENGTASSVSDGKTGAATEERLADKDVDKEVLSDNIEAVVCPKDPAEAITLAEAKETALLGEYVPETLPAGYILESVRKFCNEDTNEVAYITLCWTKGMDTIFMTISKVDAADITTIDITKPETYDVHRYEIPYADTVPEAYRSSFHNPVFAEGDFARDIVKARMKVVADQGDTDTPRGNFAVLYDEGVLVEFNGDGDAESIFEMFSSLQ